MAYEWEGGEVVSGGIRQPLDAIEDKDGGVELRVRVQPRASRNALRVEPDGRIRVAVTAPPVDDAANEALAAYVAKVLGMPKRAVSVVRGEKSREKTLWLTGADAATVRARLAAF